MEDFRGAPHTGLRLLPTHGRLEKEKSKKKETRGSGFFFACCGAPTSLPNYPAPSQTLKEGGEDFKPIKQKVP
jgi:hypothetical protein